MDDTATRDIVYIGAKQGIVNDPLGGTGIVWHGHGDVQRIPAKAATLLVAHYPSMFQLTVPSINEQIRDADDSEAALQVLLPDGRTKPLAEATDKEVRNDLRERCLPALVDPDERLTRAQLDRMFVTCYRLCAENGTLGELSLVPAGDDGDENKPPPEAPPRAASKATPRAKRGAPKAKAAPATAAPAPASETYQPAAPQEDPTQGDE